MTRALANTLVHLRMRSWPQASTVHLTSERGEAAEGNPARPDPVDKNKEVLVMLGDARVRFSINKEK